MKFDLPDHLRLCNNPYYPDHFHHSLVWICNWTQQGQTSENQQFSRECCWFQLPLYPGSVPVQGGEVSRPLRLLFGARMPKPPATTTASSLKLSLWRTLEQLQRMKPQHENFWTLLNVLNLFMLCLCLLCPCTREHKCTHTWPIKLRDWTYCFFILFSFLF